MPKSRPPLRTKPTGKALPKKARGRSRAQKRPARGQTSSDRYCQALVSSPLSIWNVDFSKVKRSFDTLRKQGKEDFREFLLSHPEEVLSMISKIKVRWVNDATLRLFKVQNIDQLRRGMKKTLFKESYELCREGLIKLAEGNTEFSIEGVALSSGGKRLHLMVTASVQNGTEHTLSDAFLYCTDISGLKNRKARLRESEEKYRRIFRKSPYAAFVADTETGIILNANKKAEELLGTPAEEIIGMHQTEIHPEEEKERYRRIFKEAAKNAEFVSESLLLKSANGKDVPVQILSALVDLPGRQIIIGTFSPVCIAEGRAFIPPATDFPNRLSDRETEILGLIASGLSSRQIAERLSISPKTVETHRSRMMKKLGAHKSADLIRYALFGQETKPAAKLDRRHS